MVNLMENELELIKKSNHLQKVKVTIISVIFAFLVYSVAFKN